MIKRLIYWLTHKHHCKACCLFCKFYNKCKYDTEIDTNVCVTCGEIVPEGRQVCPNCEKGVSDNE